MDAALDTLVEAGQLFGFGAGAVVKLEAARHALHRLRYGVLPSELVLGKEGIEHGLGDKVLGEHTDGMIAGDTVVQVALEGAEEGSKRGLERRIVCRE